MFKFKFFMEIILNEKNTCSRMEISEILYIKVKIDFSNNFSKDCCDEHFNDHHSYALTMCNRLHSYKLK
jgi:hypothetical protein